MSWCVRVFQFYHFSGIKVQILLQMLAEEAVASDEDSRTRSSASSVVCLLHAVLIRASISISVESGGLYAVNSTTQPPLIRSWGTANSPVLSEEVKGHVAPFI